MKGKTKWLASLSGMIGMLLAGSVSPAGGPMLRPTPSKEFLDQDFATVSQRAALPAGLISDGGFELGTPNPVWSESSTNFGTPLCDINSCASDFSHSGAWWAWFGGITAPESGALSQDFTIPTGTAYAELEFYVAPWVCDPDSPEDFLKIAIDGIEIWSVFADSPLCGQGDPSYLLRRVDITPWADGIAHTLELFAEIFSPTGGLSDFFVDDVSIVGDATSAPVVRSFVRLGDSPGVPNPALCGGPSDYGRIIVDGAAGTLYICSRSGWVGK